MEGHAVSSQHEGDEEPGSCSHKLVGVQESHGDEKNDENNSCCFGGVVFIGLPAAMR